MEPKKDWILDNIKGILKEKALKVETVSSEIGISKGEFSKILSGEREHYFKYLPQIAQSLGVSFHQLVTPPPQEGTSVKETDCEHSLLYDKIIGVCDERNAANQKIIEMQNDLIQKLNQEIERLKTDSQLP